MAGSTGGGEGMKLFVGISGIIFGNWLALFMLPLFTVTTFRHKSSRCGTVLWDIHRDFGS